jgi:hypothetical protein
MHTFRSNKLMLMLGLHPATRVQIVGRPTPPTLLRAIIPTSLPGTTANINASFSRFPCLKFQLILLTEEFLPLLFSLLLPTAFHPFDEDWAERIVKQWDCYSALGSVFEFESRQSRPQWVNGHGISLLTALSPHLLINNQRPDIDLINLFFFSRAEAVPHGPFVSEF